MYENSPAWQMELHVSTDTFGTYLTVLLMSGEACNRLSYEAGLLVTFACDTDEGPKVHSQTAESDKSVGWGGEDLGGLQASPNLTSMRTHAFIKEE